MKQKILTSQSKVRFQDCDPFNHLNNSKYLDYFINAREDQLILAYDLDIFDIAKRQLKSWVVGDHKIAYLSSAKSNEVVVIESQLINFSKNRLYVEMKMYDADRKKLHAILWTTFVHIDMRTQKPLDHVQEYVALFEEVRVPISAESFNERVYQIKKAA